jgi:hypothetical protein
MDIIRLGKRGAIVQEETGALESVRAVSLDRGKWLATEEAVAVCFAVAACLVHLLWNGRYGYLRGVRATPGLGIRGPCPADRRDRSIVAHAIW